MPRLGKLRFTIEYVVDLDNEDQVDTATFYIIDDVKAVVIRRDYDSYISQIEDSTLTEREIHTSLLEDGIGEET